MLTDQQLPVRGGLSEMGKNPGQILHCLFFPAFSRIGKMIEGPGFGKCPVILFIIKAPFIPIQQNRIKYNGAVSDRLPASLFQRVERIWKYQKGLPCPKSCLFLQNLYLCLPFQDQ